MVLVNTAMARSVAAGIAEEEGITKTQHDAVGSGAAHHWLVVVIAHGVGVGQIVQVWRIAFLHVVKAHGGGTFTSGAIIEIDGQGLSVCACSHGYFYPWEQVRFAAAGIFGGGVFDVAIFLLPHLVKAVYRACSVIIVRETLGR